MRRACRARHAAVGVPSAVAGRVVRVCRGARADARPGARVAVGVERERARVRGPRGGVLGGRSCAAAPVAAGAAGRGRLAGDAGGGLGRWRGLCVPGAAAGSAVAVGSRRAQVPAAGRAVAGCRVAAGAGARGERTGRDRARAPADGARDPRRDRARGRRDGRSGFRGRGGLERDPARARAALAAVQDTGRDAVDDLRAILGILRSDEPAPALGREEGELGGFGSGARGPGRRSSTLGSRSCWWRWVPLCAGRRGARGAARPGVLVQGLAATAVVLRGRDLSRRWCSPWRRSPARPPGGGEPGSPATIGALLLTTFSAASNANRRTAIAAACLALGIPAVLALALAGADAADVLLPVVIVAIPWLSGRAVAAYRRQGAELRVLAQRLEREGDALARLAVLDERARVARELHDSIAHGVSVMVLQAGAAEQVMTSRPSRPARRPRRPGRRPLGARGARPRCSGSCTPTRTTARARRSRVSTELDALVEARPPRRTAGRAARRRRAGRAGRRASTRPPTASSRRR